MHHEHCRVDRHLVWVKLTGKWQSVRAVVSELFEHHAEALQSKGPRFVDSSVRSIQTPKA